MAKKLSKAAAAKKRLKVGKPVKSYKPNKKKMVVVMKNGRKKLIHYGAKGFGHNISKAARKSFRARHRCDKAKDKTTARYWACKDLWSVKSPKKTTGTKGRVAKKKKRTTRRKK
tara:strand:+ start:9982 stop:10323 length:342 start_codon:yes stop_codon:yes gene_type:complete